MAAAIAARCLSRPRLSPPGHRHKAVSRAPASKPPSSKLDIAWAGGTSPSGGGGSWASAAAAEALLLSSPV